MGWQYAKLRGATHFRYAGDTGWKSKKANGTGRYVYVVRVICAQNGARDAKETKLLRPGNIVTCTSCMVMKDFWLENGHDRKPATLRRVRKLMGHLQV